MSVFTRFIFIYISLIAASFGQGLFDNESPLGITITYDPKVTAQQMQNQEEQRVGGRYIQDQQTQARVNNTLRNTDQQLRAAIDSMSGTTVTSSDNFARIMANMGGNPSYELQRKFIEAIATSTGMMDNSSVVTVVPYLSDLNYTKINQNHSDILNRARLKVSSALAKSYVHCNSHNCSVLSLATTKEALDQMINQAVINADHADFLRSWGEDVSFSDEALSDFAASIENLEALELSDVIAQIQKQQEVDLRLNEMVNDWDVEFQDTHRQTNANSEVDQMARDIINLRSCMARQDCRSATVTNLDPSLAMQASYRQLESIVNTSKVISAASVNNETKSSAFDFLSISTDALITGDIKSSKDFEQVANSIIDVALGLTPGVGIAKDVYELVTGENLVTGEELSSFDRILSAVSVVTLGGSKYVQTGITALKKLGVTTQLLETSKNIIHPAMKLGLKAKNEITNFVQLSKQVLRADSNTFRHLDNIVESASRVNPKLGNKYVKELPDLSGSFKEAFEGTIHKGTYKPGEVLFQALRTGQDKPGRWFTPIKPIDADHAEELLNIRKWGNDASQLRVFKVKESVSGYAGKVEGGSGHQFFIPNDVPLEDVIEEIFLD